MRIYSANYPEQIEIYPSISEPQYVENIPLSLQQSAKVQARNLTVQYINGTLYRATINGGIVLANKNAKLLIKIINKNSRNAIHIR